METAPKPSDALALLGVKPAGQQVFTHLLARGPSLVADIAKSLHLPKSTTYDALAELLAASLVAEYSDERGKRFAAISAEEVTALYERKVRELSDASATLKTFIAQASQAPASTNPTTKFYFGREGIRQAFRDTMWHDRARETYLMWPTNAMLDVLGPEFSAWHSAERLRYKVHMHVIRAWDDRNLEAAPKATKRAKAKADTTHRDVTATEGWRQLRDVRIAPKRMSWSISYWIYDDTVLFAGSGDELFAFVVRSRAFASLMQLLWQQVWDVATPTEV